MVLTRASISDQLSRHLGEPVQVITVGQPVARQIRGLAISSGRVIAYLLDAGSLTLSTRTLIEFSCGARPTSLA